MSKKFEINVNNTYQFSIDEDQIEELNCVNTIQKKFHIIKNNKAYKAEILQSDFQKKTYTVCINGNSYVVNIKDELDELIKELGIDKNSKQKDSNILAPMPGLILEVKVASGQEVKKGESLLVLEAMKMENIILAPIDGIIQSIKVEKGEAVDKRQLLIEME